MQPFLETENLRKHKKKIEKKLFHILKLDIIELISSVIPCSFVSKMINRKCTFSDLNRRKKRSFLQDLEKILSLKEWEITLFPNAPLIDTLLVAIGTAKGYRTSYKECIDSILMIMGLLLEEEDQVKIAFL